MPALSVPVVLPARWLNSVCPRSTIRDFQSMHVPIPELMHRIRKGQFDFSMLEFNDATASGVWNAVLFNN
ncbi:hypothetical protein R8871_06592 [Paraburkholderia graminis C4D1M]|jgi:hypothetical protein|uniref:Uncharacterized protein n=1 Tax=Paraburkholderia graminis (strain ATCC 700544 / DSM 17151 / LMG 18924 / NCIMB 13744 / C4D1M) TaxID=396598 RepID=B1G635_PARG4|nr:hypothetical protein [Paraburkholderia graminis]EDT08389.1 hypothetical protein BgramDRAFT_4811 [Paraburkholderia graminis C4D1M]CAB3740322.1 hypothetical protein R8871_06592 [Paraburkholderia graminis C4D1M]